VLAMTCCADAGISSPDLFHPEGSAVTFEVKPPTSRFVHCHCARCRKATGASYATNIYVEPHHLTWLSGRDSVERFDLATAQSFAKWFCRTCG
jgi:hypothetical protein